MRINICNKTSLYKKLKNQLLYLGLTIILLGSIIGVSYAAFFFTGTGTKENSITTGQIVVNFNESSNIKIIDRYPETDAEGIANTDPRSTSTFTVSSDIVGDITLNYAIGLTSITEGETLKSSYVKIYMTKNGSPASGFTEGKGKTIKSLASSSIPGYFDSHALATGTLTGKKTDTYTIKAWISDTYKPKTEDNTTDTNYTKTTISETFSFKIKLVAIEGNLNQENGLDSSGANVPVLASNMIPVYYDIDNAVWKKADVNNKNASYKWYDYNNKMWANAVTVTSTNRDIYLKAAEGTPIPMEEINTMWVWIPRFSAVGDTATYNGTNDINNPGAFDITFVDNTTTAHDAFTFGTQELNGFWMGKFEMSHTTLSSSTTNNNLGCSNNACNNSNGLLIKPNVVSLKYNSVSNFFYGISSMKQSSNSFGFDNSVDTHMIKNNEWGAVAYLTQSLYGRCSSSTSCTKVHINNSCSDITGYGTGGTSIYNQLLMSNSKPKVILLAGDIGASPCDTGDLYNTNVGTGSSTTGNIYGVYDMSGGAMEYVMGLYKPSTLSNITDNSGFSNSTSNSKYEKLPNNKYYTAYTTESNYTSANFQHALKETEGWYDTNMVIETFVYDRSPWLGRGGRSSNEGTADIFYFIDYDGSWNSYNSSRAILSYNT